MSEVAERQSEIEALQEMLDTLDPDSRSLAAEYDLGDQAEEFFHSPLGRYMLGAAQQDMRDAHTKLKTTLPFRWRRIQQLQNEIRVAEMFPLYLRDLIIRGRAAEQALETRDES